MYLRQQANFRNTVCQEASATEILTLCYCIFQTLTKQLYNFNWSSILWLNVIPKYTCAHISTYNVHRQRTSNMRTSVLSYDIQSQSRRPVEITELFCYCLKYLVAEDRNFRRTGFLVDSFTNPEFWIFKNVFCCCFLSKQARLSLVGSEFEIEN